MEGAGRCARRRRIGCTVSGDGFGPSDQTPFTWLVPAAELWNLRRLPQVSDPADKINAAGAAQVAQVAHTCPRARSEAHLAQGSGARAAGDMRSFHASLGTIPIYAGPEGGKKGVLLVGPPRRSRRKSAPVRPVRLQGSRSDERRRADVRAQRVEARRDAPLR